jgi:DNA-binding GntR family transcriptional regulator
MQIVDLAGIATLMPPLNERRTAAEHVAHCLRTAIQSGRLQEGVELNQVALAVHFQVSRVPIREALRALEAEGWITARAHHKAAVLGISADRVRQIFEVRALLEAHLISKVIRRIGKEQLQNLTALCDAMDEMDEHDEWVAANRKFHRILLETSGAGMIVDLVEQLISQVERYLRLSGAGPRRQGQAGAEHRAILDAVARRQVGKARSLLRSHIGRTKELVLVAISRREKIGGGEGDGKARRLRSDNFTRGKLSL